MQPGRSAAPAAPRTEPAAARSPQPGSGPAGAAKPGLEHRSGAAARRGGGGEEGGARPPRAACKGHGQLWGSLPAMLEAPSGRGWGGGRGGLPPPRAVSRDRARSLKPGVDRLFGSGLSRARQPAHRWPGRGPALRRPRRGARLQRAARGRGAQGRFRRSPLPQPHPTLRLPAALRGSQRAAVRHQPAAGIGDCGSVPGPRCPSRPDLGPPAVPPRSVVDPSVTQSFPNPTAPFA